MNDVVKIWFSEDEDEVGDEGGIYIYDTQRFAYWHPNDLIGRKIVSVEFKALGTTQLELEEVVKDEL